jgi:hypothetical protein
VAILLEIVFVVLAIFILKGYVRSLYICIALASLIIIGKPVNTIVLIIGGYILQALLICTSMVAILNKRSGDSSRSNETLTASRY